MSYLRSLFQLRDRWLSEAEAARLMERHDVRTTLALCAAELHADLAEREGRPPSVEGAPFSAGDDYLRDNATQRTYTIDAWGCGEQIEVHGDESLRDLIVDLLNDASRGSGR